MLSSCRATSLACAGAIGLLGLVTVAQGVCVLGGGVLVDGYGTRHVGMLGLMLLALAVICVMTAPIFMLGATIYAATLGAGLGILRVVQGGGLAEHFGTRHLGTLRGTTLRLKRGGHD